ncbi:MAG TPA: ABC transporter ATP-binding protein [Trueperaceae bacterium]
MNETYVAQLERVTKRYGDVLALDEVTLRVRAGEVLAVLGPNGAGKTTAVSTLLGLLRPDEGAVSLFGTSPNDVSAKVRVGAMLQISGVPPTLTVREHVTAFAAYYPAPLAVDDAIALAGLGEVANRQYGKLSGGQKQRLHFALAMVGDPDLLFLDEPTTGLDVESRRDFWRQVRSFSAEGRTVVLTTHYLEEADALADRIVLLDHGRVIAEGSPAEIKARTGGKVVKAVTRLAPERLADLPGVSRVERVGTATELYTGSAEATVRALLAADDGLHGLEVKGATLEEAFLNITGGHGPADTGRGDGAGGVQAGTTPGDGRAGTTRGASRADREGVYA